MLTVVSAASENHAKSLIQFLNSLFLHEKDIQCYVYDLGLNQETVDLLKQFNIIYKKFNFERYPDYFNISIN